MELHITGRNDGVTDAMKTYAGEKLERLERHNDMLVRAEVVMNIEAEERHMVEMIAHTKVGERLIAKTEHSNMYAAVDLLLDKMEHQLTKQKERVKTDKKHARAKISGAMGASPGGKARPEQGLSGDEMERDDT